MTVTLHWGKWVSTGVPIGGVVNVNRLEGVIHDLALSGLDLGFEPGWREFERTKIAEFEEAYWATITNDEPHDDPTPDEELIAEWKEEYGELYDTPGLILIGDWVKDRDGLYEPDQAGEFAAIVDYDSNVVMVKHSTVIKRCALCSPCYPGQADLESEGEYLGYDLPAYFYPQPPLYTVVIEVRRVIDGIVLSSDNWQDSENLFSATVQSPRGDLQRITNIARGAWDIVGDQLRSMPE